MNLGAQMGPVSITKLSPNWVCQMGPIHCPKFLLIPYSPIGTEIIREWRRRLITEETFSKYKIVAAYTKHKNLAQILSSNLRPITNSIVHFIGGALKCNSPRCQTCEHLTVTKHFSSTYTRRSYIIKDTLNCKNHNVIYLITCRKCNKQYVGETSRQLAQRLSDHRSNIKLRRDTLIAAHFNDEAHTIQHLSITPIEQLKTNKHFTRLQRELYWIHQLMTYAPYGLNKKHHEPSTGREWRLKCNHNYDSSNTLNLSTLTDADSYMGSQASLHLYE